MFLKKLSHWLNYGNPFMKIGKPIVWMNDFLIDNNSLFAIIYYSEVKMRMNR